MIDIVENSAGAVRVTRLTDAEEVAEVARLLSSLRARRRDGAVAAPPEPALNTAGDGDASGSTGS